MSSSTGKCVAPDAILDADLVRRLWHFYEPDGVSLKKFSKSTRKSGYEDLHQILKPFLRKLPTISGLDGKRATKVKDKAAVLILRDSDLEVLQALFCQDHMPLKSFKAFIQRGCPDQILQLFKDAAESGVFKTVSTRLQVLLQVRGHELRAVCSEDGFKNISVLSDTETASSKRTSQNKAIEAAEIQDILDQIDKPQKQEILNVYKHSLDLGLTYAKAYKKALRAARRKQRSILKPDDARKAYPSPSSPAIHAPTSSTDAINFKAPDAKHTVSNANKRKRPSMDKPDEQKASAMPKKQKMASDFAIDGHQDTYNILISSPRAHFPRSTGKDKHLVSSKDASQRSIHTKPNTSKHKSSGEQRIEMTDAERQLLEETLGLTARKAFKSQDQLPAPELKSNTPDDTIFETTMGTSNQIQASLSVRSEDELLMESLRLTARSKKPQLATRSIVNSGAMKEPVGRSAQSASPVGRAGDGQVSAVKLAKKTTLGAHGLDQTKYNQAAVNASNMARASKGASLVYSTGGTGASADDARAAARRKREDDFLLECLAMTAKTSSSSNAPTIANPQNGSPMHVIPQILPSTETNESIIPNSSDTPELSDGAFSPPAERARKQRSIAPVRQPELRLHTSDMLVVEESEYGEDGNKLERQSTMRKRKITRTCSPCRKSMPSEDTQELLDAQLRKSSGSRPSDTQSDASSRQDLSHPAICQTM
jgi:hypothetical protein